ncbi:MAG: DUF5060 domain-containing protein [Candidatus Omnitrophica bacterium]|nr:DUF5060 domain-containing protein [Candidatus Omnitrophota bacterium]
MKLMKRLIFSFFLIFLSHFLSADVLFDFENGLQDWTSAYDSQNISTSSNFVSSGAYSLSLGVKNERESWIKVEGDFDWLKYDNISFDIYVPSKAKNYVSLICYVKDKNWTWFQTDLFQVKLNERQRFSIDISDTSSMWQPMTGSVCWDGYTKRNIREFGIKIFYYLPFSGTVYIDNIQAMAEPEERKIFLFNFNTNAETIFQYDKFEVTFELPLILDNPFDPEEIDISGIFHSPSGKTISVPGFFYRDYIRCLEEDGEQLYPYGKHQWCIRFAPEETGNYSYEIVINFKGKTYRFDCGTFNCIKGNNPGFIRWDKQDSFCLSFSNGKFFYPIGHVLRSPDDVRQPYNYEFTPDKGKGTFAYDEYFKKMKDNLENYIRMWMGAWWVGIEWTPAYAQHYEGIGRYSLENSWKLDYVLDIARENGIYIVLTLINHGQFSIRPDAEWWDNPYNIINGGFLNSPDEFFYSREAEKFFLKRLRYIVARWGYSTQIAFWELWNEVDLTGYYDSQNVRLWHEHIIPLLREIDPWKHPVTSHICRPQADPMVWIAKGLETLVSNAYSSTVVDTMREYYFKRKPFNKPMQIHEFGVGRNGKELENNLHAGIWTSSLSPMLGTALFWWWPFIDKKDLYFHYRALARFLDGIDRRGKNFQLSTARVVDSSGNKSLRAGVTGIQNTTSAYLWVYDSAIFNSRNPEEKTEPITGAKIVVEFLEQGNYKIEFWDTYRGEKFLNFEKQFSEGDNEIQLPDFIKDIAIKIEKKHD